MSTTNDGGPAFPIPPVGTGDPRDGMSRGSDGMTLRDWLAGQIACGMAASAHWTENVDENCNAAPYAFAKAAYHTADAMLAAREKGSQ